MDGDVVYKLHRPGTDPRALTVRLRTAARLECFLTPLSTEPERVGMRWRTSWPRVETVVPEPDCIPWADAGQLLARLHAEAVGERLPPHGWPGRLRRTVERLRCKDADEVVAIRRAATGLPPEAWRAGSPDRPRTLVHGDWHLGQLGRRSAHERGCSSMSTISASATRPGTWPARPGSGRRGCIPDAGWTTFIDTYRDAGGAALPPSPADPWQVLDPFARAAVVQAAAGNPDDELLLAACARMA